MKEFINKNTKELMTMLSEKRIALRNFRFSVAGSNTRNVKEGMALRRDIARIMTVMNKNADKEKGGKQISKKPKAEIKTPKAN